MVSFIIDFVIFIIWIIIGILEIKDMKNDKVNKHHIISYIFMYILAVYNLLRMLILEILFFINS